MDKGDEKEFGMIVDNLKLELRRGMLVLSVLSQLRTPKYGYSLVELLAAKGMPVEPGTLYPLLRRLESQKLLESTWETSGAKPRKYYTLSAGGRSALDLLAEEWRESTKHMIGLLREEA